MGRRSREIGWSQEAILLYEISRELDLLLRLKYLASSSPIDEGEFLAMENGGLLLDENGNGILLE